MFASMEMGCPNGSIVFGSNPAARISSSVGRPASDELCHGVALISVTRSLGLARTKVKVNFSILLRQKDAGALMLSLQKC